MKKVALLFVLAVLVPSGLLALLAARTLRDQQFVVERQQSLLYQTVTDALAGEINAYLADQQRQFNEQVERLMTNPQPLSCSTFDDQLRAVWPLAEVGFAVTLAGSLLCPSPTTRTETRDFCRDNSGFLANKEYVEVYCIDPTPKSSGASAGPGGHPKAEPPPPAPGPVAYDGLRGEATNSLPPTASLKTQTRKVNPAQPGAPKTAADEPAAASPSKVVSTEAEFGQLIGEASDGLVARFVQNKLRLLFWHRLASQPQLVFGAQLNLARISDAVRALVRQRTAAAALWPAEIAVVILDDNANPIAVSNPEFQAQLPPVRAANAVGPAALLARTARDLKRPFVATEIGEALPHWEVAAYLMNPEALKQTARTGRLSLGLLIALLLVALGVGSWLIVHDLHRQMTLARQKTDFVSNVSHELKTPLTSIRMFAELLAEGRVNDPAKQRSYLNVITAETARLTRLINNVLDFARFERGEQQYQFIACDLAGLARATAESYRPHLEHLGFTLDCQLGDAPLPVRGDPDALAQILVNLLSNAEKYSNGAKAIEIRASRRDAPEALAEIQVLDRGPGVPRGCEDRIFEQFYRADDSLSSGVQGSGLGLTLARQIARAHGGDVVYEPRAGGGSCFALRLPVTGDAGAAR